MVHCGGGTDSDLLASVVRLAALQAGRGDPKAVVVDLGWHTQRPVGDACRLQAEIISGAGARATDSGLIDRSDAKSAEICNRLAAADLIWFLGGDAAAIYDRLWATPALAAIQDAHARGAVVGGVSAGAMVWGIGTLSDRASLGDPEPFPLFGWLSDLVIFAHYAPNREPAFRERLRAFPGCRGLALAHGGAVLVDSGSTDLRVLREGANGLGHALLLGPDERLLGLES